MIIVEGMDNTGKSTIAKLLSETLDLPIVDRHGRPSSDEVIQQILSFILLDPPAILDRHPLISEHVYSSALGDRRDVFQPPFTLNFYLERLLRDNPLIVYCRPPISNISSFKGEQMPGVIENCNHIIATYDHFMDYLEGESFIVYRYDYTRLDEPGKALATAWAYLKARGEL